MKQAPRSAALLGLVVALAFTAGPARAEGPPARPVRTHAVELGLGSHFGGFGGSYTFRLDKHWAAMAGLGALAGRVGAGGGVRFYPWGPLYAQVGASPIAYATQKVYYGPDVMAGVDLVRTRVSFTFGVGLGVLNFKKVYPCLDLGIGVNFGRSPDDRFGEPAETASPKSTSKE